MKAFFRIISVCVLIAVFAVMFAACGSDDNKTEVAEVIASESAAQAATLSDSQEDSSASGDLTAEEMEIAVHNSFSDSFAKTINESDIFSMKMYSEGNYVVWDLTFKEHLDSEKLSEYKDKLVNKDLTQNLEAVRAAVRNDISNTNFGMIVRYHNAEGEVVLEQTAQ